MSKKRILYVNWKPFLDNILYELVYRAILSIYIFNRNLTGINWVINSVMS